LEIITNCFVNQFLIENRFPGEKVNNTSIGGAYSGGAWNDEGKMLLYYTDSVQTEKEFIEI
jgi:hypothetical protein